MQIYYEYINPTQYEYIVEFNIHNSILFTDDRQYNLLLIKTLLFQNDEVLFLTIINIFV